MTNQLSARGRKRVLREAISRYEAEGFCVARRGEFEARLVLPNPGATFMQQLIGQGVERTICLRVTLWGEVEETP